MYTNNESWVVRVLEVVSDFFNCVICVYLFCILWNVLGFYRIIDILWSSTLN